MATYTPSVEEETGKAVGGYYHTFCYITRGEREDSVTSGRNVGHASVGGKGTAVLTVRIPSGRGNVRVRSSVLCLQKRAPKHLL